MMNVSTIRERRKTMKGQASSSFIIYNMGAIAVGFVRVKLDEFSIYSG